MRNREGKEYQPEKLDEMVRGLYVYVPQMRQKALLPIGREGDAIYGAVYSELDNADPGDLFVLHRGRLLHALLTMAEGMIMVEMPARSALNEQPLKD